jgi:hypothetical protein
VDGLSQIQFGQIAHGAYLVDIYAEFGRAIIGA